MGTGAKVIESVMGLRLRPGNFGWFFRSLCQVRVTKQVTNNLRTSLRFPCLDHYPTIDYEYLRRIKEIDYSASQLLNCLLTLKAPITTAADDIHKCFFIVFRGSKT